MSECIHGISTQMYCYKCAQSLSQPPRSISREKVKTQFDCCGSAFSRSGSARLISIDAFIRTLRELGVEVEP